MTPGRRSMLKARPCPALGVAWVEGHGQDMEEREQQKNDAPVGKRRYKPTRFGEERFRPRGGAPVAGAANLEARRPLSSDRMAGWVEPATALRK